MPRPKPLTPKARLHIVIPAALYARLRLIFFTTGNETGLMKGAISEFIEAAIKEKLERQLTNDISGRTVLPSQSTGTSRSQSGNGQGDAGAISTANPII